MKKLAILILIISFALPVSTFGQIGIWSDFETVARMVNSAVQANQANLQGQPVNTLKVQTWQLPRHMLDNLKYMKAEFDRQFQAQLEYFISEVRKHYDEFGNMPADVILADFDRGILVTRKDYARILEQAQAKKKR